MQRRQNMMLPRVNHTMSEQKAQSKHATNQSLPISLPNIADHKITRNINNRNLYFQKEENAIKQSQERAGYYSALKKRQQAERLADQQNKIIKKKNFLQKQITNLQQKIAFLVQRSLQISQKKGHIIQQKHEKIKRCRQYYQQKKQQTFKKIQQQYLKLKEHLALAENNQDQFLISLYKEKLQECKKKKAKFEQQLNEQLKKIQMEYEGKLILQQQLEEVRGQVKYLRSMMKQKYLQIEKLEERELGDKKITTSQQIQIKYKFKKQQTQNAKRGTLTRGSDQNIDGEGGYYSRKK